MDARPESDLPAARAEFAILRSGAGLVELGGYGAVFVEGPDALSWAQGFLTNDLRQPVGQGCYTLAVLLKGRIFCDVLYSRLAAETLLFSTEAGLGPELAEHLDRFLIAENAQIEARGSSYLRWGLVGPQAAEILASLGIAGPLAIGGSVALPGQQGWCLRSAWLAHRGVALQPESFDLLVPAEGAEELRSALLEAGARAVGAQALRWLALTHGRPGSRAFRGLLPQEADLEGAVSFTKGCYLGQETVARVHYKGGVKKMLSALSGGPPLEPGTPLEHEGRAVGSVLASAVVPSLAPEALHLACLRLEHRQPGNRVQVGAQSIEVVVLPLSG